MQAHSKYAHRADARAEPSGSIYCLLDTGGDMASTQVAKPQVHAEDVTHLVKHVAKKLVANDDNYSLAA